MDINDRSLMTRLRLACVKRHELRRFIFNFMQSEEYKVKGNLITKAIVKNYHPTIETELNFLIDGDQGQAMEYINDMFVKENLPEVPKSWHDNY